MQLRALFAPYGGTFIGMSNAQHRRFIKGAPDNLHRQWQAFGGKEAVLEGEGRSFAEIKAERAGTDDPTLGDGNGEG